MSQTVDLNSTHNKIMDGVSINDITSKSQLVGIGTDRDVYKINNNTVIKISKRPNDNINQTSREIDFYNNVKKSGASEKFAKITEYKYGTYICQEYLNTNKHISSKDIEKWKSEVISHGITVYDDRKVNFGYRGDNLVMLDYAGCFFN